MGVEGKIVKTANHDIELDALIIATGFDVTKSMYDTGLVGREGKDLAQAWQGNPEAYLGICTSGFPNAFFLLGPNTGLGHNSVIFMIECQVDYIIQVIKGMLVNNLASVDVKEEAQEAFNKKLQEDMKGLVFTSSCASWYMNSFGKIYALWSGSCLQYWRALKFQLSDYIISHR